MQFRVALRRYLMECLFECDEGDLPGEALQAIAFINRGSGCKSVDLSKQGKYAEVDAVLVVSSQLRALAYDDAEDCSDDDGLMSLGNVNCGEDNDFIFPETNYFNCNSEQHMDEPCSSKDTPKAADMDNCCSSESRGATHHVPEAEPSDSKVEKDVRKPCEKTKNSRATHYYRDGIALETAVDTDHWKRSIRSKDLSEICEGTSTAAHMIIGQILDRWLITEDGELEAHKTSSWRGLGLEVQEYVGNIIVTCLIPIV
jgi:hypothetical protein